MLKKTARQICSLACALFCLWFSIRLSCNLPFTTDAGKQQRTFPDYVIYLNALANHNYESFMEVKWPEQMNKEEDDTVKLRKQMQFALNKFVDAGVEDPLIVGLTVEAL